MRRRIPYRVCRCMPNGVVTHLEARLLKDIVNQAIHPIRCAESCKRKFSKGMYIGDLCAETGHFWWALKVWRLTISLIEDKDYDDWIDVWFDNKNVSLRDVVSETECELLCRRCSNLWRALGYHWWSDWWEHITSVTFGSHYYLWQEKYDYDPCIMQIEWEDAMSEYKAKQDTELLFREALGDDLPPCSQDFTEYWHGGPCVEDFSGIYISNKAA